MRALFTLLVLCIFAIPAHAAFQGPNSAASVTTAAQVAKAGDDASCMLQGNIIEKVTGSDDKYRFKDATGTVIVEIDHQIFAGRVVTPSTVVKLYGEVDTSLTKASKVDVKMMEIVQ